MFLSSIVIYVSLMIFVSRYRCQILISMFFSVQKICVTSLKMVCCWTVLALWANDQGSASWALSVEYGYNWCSWCYGISIDSLLYSCSLLWLTYIVFWNSLRLDKPRFSFLLVKKKTVLFSFDTFRILGSWL